MGRKVHDIQSTFTSGELDPKLAARQDLKHYYNGAERMRNVIVLPQGGFERRYGMKYIDEFKFQIDKVSEATLAANGTWTAPEGGTAADAYTDGSTLTTVNTMDGDGEYVIWHVDFGSTANGTFEYIDIIGARTTGGTTGPTPVLLGAPEVPGVPSFAQGLHLQYSSDDATWADADFFIYVYDEGTFSHSLRVNVASYPARYWRLVKRGTTGTTGGAKMKVDNAEFWTATSTLSEVVLVPFKDAAGVQYMIALTDNHAQVYYDSTGAEWGQFAHEVPSASLEYVSFLQSYDTLFLYYSTEGPGSYAPLRITNVSSNQWSWEEQTYDNMPYDGDIGIATNPSGTVTPSDTTGIITLTGSAAVFASTDVGQKVYGNGGQARIIQFVSTTVVDAVIEIPFYDTAAIANGSWSLTSNFTKIIDSDTSDAPWVGVFHEGRHYLGKEAWVLGSRVGQLFDFEQVEGLDNEGVSALLDSDNVNNIRALVSGDHLQILTSNSEWYVPQNEGQPITPARLVPKEPTARGIIRKPKNFARVRDSTIFIGSEGRQINRFKFDEVNKYQTENVALLAAHLIRGAISIAARRPTSTAEADLIFIVNEDDGTMAICTYLPEQEVIAWTLAETTGTILDVAVVGEHVYVAVEREINSVTVRFLELLDKDHYLDCSKRITTGLPQDVFTVAHLPSTTVAIYADGAYVGTGATNGSGSIDIGDDATTAVEIGLPFPSYTDDDTIDHDKDGTSIQTPHVRTMPIDNVLPDGTAVGRLKRVVDVVVSMLNSQYIEAQGEALEIPTNSSASYDDPYTGQKQVTGLRGHDDFGQVDITQASAGPMVVRAVKTKVDL